MERQQGKYRNAYATYLVTPHPQRSLDARNATMADLAKQGLRNLIEFPVVIGIVERISEPLELLRHVIDFKDKVRGLFQMLGMDSKG
jgi:hypothetical protein